MIEILPLPTDAEVEPGDDLVTLLLATCDEHGVELRDGDVVCVAQKVVSKAEGALVTIDDPDEREARRRVARDQAARIVADTPEVLIVETRHGFVCANAGVDASNLPAGTVALLPEDPDSSARAIAVGVAERTGVRTGVVVTDTFGRPWRVGQTDVAIGVAGIEPLRDERGAHDRHGRQLDVTVAAVADEIAGAADLARRKADGAPFVVVRGLDLATDRDVSAAELVRPADEDLFRVAARGD